MFGWVLLLYLVIGAIAVFGGAGKILYDLCQVYDPDIVFDATKILKGFSMSENAGQRSFQMIIGIIVWPSRLSNLKMIKETLASECEFQTRMK